MIQINQTLILAETAYVAATRGGQAADWRRQRRLGVAGGGRPALGQEPGDEEAREG